MTIEICAIVFLLVSIASTGFVWRLQSTPISVNFAKTYVQSALNSEVEGFRVQMEDIVLFWPDLGGPLLLGLQNAKIIDADDNAVLSIDEIAVGLSKRRLLIGQVAPTDLLIRKPKIRITRKENGRIDFGLGDNYSISLNEKPQADKSEIASQTSLADDILTALDGGQGLASALLSKMESVRIMQANISLRDEGRDIQMDIPNASVDMRSDSEALRASLWLDFEMREAEEVETVSAPIAVHVVLDKNKKSVQAQAQIQALDIGVLGQNIAQIQQLGIQDMQISGEFSAVLDEHFMPVTAAFSLAVPQGQFQHDFFDDAPQRFQDLALEASYADERLRIENIAITSKDVTVRANGALQKSGTSEGAGYGEFSGPLHITIDDIPHAHVSPLWPQALDEENAKEWIVDKLSEGDLSELKASMDVFLSHEDATEWDIDAQGVRAEFAFDNMDVDYRSPLPPVTQARGRGVFVLDEEKLSITVEEGELGGLSVEEAQLEFYHIIQKGKGVADMAIKLEGPLRNALDYIATEPIGLREELDMDIALVKGNAALQVNLEFPTVKDLQIEQMDIDVQGTVNEAFVPDVLEGLPLSGGPFEVDVNNERYTIRGGGAFSGRPVRVDWQEFINSEGKPYKNKANVTITADPNLRSHFGIDLSDFAEGPVDLDIAYTGYRNQKAVIVVKGNAGPSVLKLDAFDYQKMAGQDSNFALTVRMENNQPKLIEDFSLRAPGMKIENGRLGLQRGADGSPFVNRVEIGRMTVGETIGQLDVEIEKSGLMKIVLNGPFLDLRPFLQSDEADEKTYEGPPVMISVAVDQMRTADEETVQYGKIYADIDAQGRFNQLEMDAIAGGGDIYLRYKPNEEGVRTFRFEADNAGAALKAFQVYSQIRGGKIVIYGEPIDNVYDRNIVGLAEMTDFKVVEAPVLARLMGAMSLPGLAELLDGEGVSFAKLEANFDWLYRPQGGLLVLKDGRTSGNSLGLTFDGVIDNPAQSMDVSGTIIPLSGINKMVSSIPLIGDILSGGSGAIFAATYSIKGSTEEPEVNVNPLAALTPGILRRILFE